MTKTSFVILWLLIILITSGCGNNSYTPNMQTNMRNGDKIVLALAKYKATNGVLPSNLSDLVPSYLTELPVTVSGKSFYYKKRDGDGYDFDFSFDTVKNSDGSIDWDCQYRNSTNSVIGGWECENI